MELNENEKNVQLVKAQLDQVTEKMKNDFGIDLNAIEKNSSLTQDSCCEVELVEECKVISEVTGSIKLCKESLTMKQNEEKEVQRELISLK